MSGTALLLDQLTRDTQRSETEVLALAMEAGLRQLWREHVLGRFLRGEIDRRQTIEEAGLDWVEMAERQHRAMVEDVEWGLNKTVTR